MLYLQSRYRLDMQEEQHLEIIWTGNISRNEFRNACRETFRSPQAVFIILHPGNWTPVTVKT